MDVSLALASLPAGCNATVVLDCCHSSLPGLGRGVPKFDLNPWFNIVQYHKLTMSNATWNEEWSKISHCSYISLRSQVPAGHFPVGWQLRALENSWVWKCHKTLKCQKFVVTDRLKCSPQPLLVWRRSETNLNSAKCFYCSSHSQRIAGKSLPVLSYRLRQTC